MYNSGQIKGGEAYDILVATGVVSDPGVLSKLDSATIAQYKKQYLGG